MGEVSRASLAQRECPHLDEGSEERCGVARSMVVMVETCPLRGPSAVMPGGGVVARRPSQSEVKLKMKPEHNKLVDGLRGIPITNLVENWSFTIEEIAPYVF